MTNLFRTLILGCSSLALAACGADDVVAPGGNVTINNPAPTPAPAGPAAGTIQAAASCTAGTGDLGIITLQGGKGTVRNCGIPTAITGTLTLGGRRKDGIMYSLVGRTDVGTDVRQGGAAATLNILAGVTVFGAIKESNLVVNRGSKLNANGTAADPVIFTGLDNLTSASVSQYATNLWGGIILNGNAPVSDCSTTVGSSTVGGDANCWRESEGIIPRPVFGGNQAADSSGSLTYVQVNFTGVTVGIADEIQGITLNGVGAGTTMHHIQIHNSSDDGIEAFGGTVNMDHLVLTGNADDSLDTDNGYRGAVQFVYAARHDANGYDGDSGAAAETLLEVDTSSQPVDATPRQFLKLANFTFVQNKTGETTMRIRGGADIALLNGVVVSRPSGAQGCLDVDDAATVQAAGAAAQEVGPPIMRSVVFDCDVVADPDADTFEATALANPANSGVNTTFANMLAFLTGSTVGRVANGTNETGVAAAAALATDPTYGSPFFQQVTYIGAFSGPNDLWTQGWTCNSVIVDLRGTNSCTDVRIS